MYDLDNLSEEEQDTLLELLKKKSEVKEETKDNSIYIDIIVILISFLIIRFFG